MVAKGLFDSFWKLGEATVNDEKLYNLFNYDGSSFWWALTGHQIVSRRSRILNIIKENYKETINTRIKKIDRNIDIDSADVILVNTLFKRRKQKYFGSISDELSKLDISNIEIFSYFPYPIDILKKNESEKTKDIFSFAKKEHFEKADKEKKLKMKLYKEMKHDEKFQNYLNSTFKGGEYSTVKDYLENVFKYYYPRSVLYYEIFKYIIEKLKPKVFCNLHYRGAVVYPEAIACKKMGVKRMWIFHGIFIPYVYSIPKEIVQKGFLLPDKVCAYGPRDINTIVQSNFPPESIFVGGCPRYDQHVIKYSNMSKDKIAKKYHLDDKSNYILWATNESIRLPGYNNKEDSEIREVFETFRELDQKLLIKPHWLDQNIKLYEKFNKEFKIDAKLFNKNDDIIELAMFCDATMLKNSSVGTEIIALKKPIIIMDFTKNADLSYYISYGFRAVSNKNELINEIKKLNTKEFGEEFLDKRKRLLDDSLAHFGSSSKVIAQELSKLL
jgi:hypothetical protein